MGCQGQTEIIKYHFKKEGEDMSKNGFVLSLILSFCIISFFAAQAMAGWTTEFADAPKYFTHFYSRAIAVDSNGFPHIAYGGDHLYHAYHDGMSWNYETIDPSSLVGDYASIAVDSEGAVHVSYYDLTNSGLKYATNASGSWKTFTLDSVGDVSSVRFVSYGYCTSIAVDPEGAVHISYFDGNDYNIKYATNASGSWEIYSLDSAGGTYSSIVVDPEGTVHISYCGKGLKYATNASGSWKTYTLDSAGSFTSIAVDPEGAVHISYYDYSNNDLKYATNASGSWETFTLDSADYVGQYSSIAVDPEGAVHISYFDWSNKNLKYATNASGSWETFTLDSADYVGEYTSMAVDPDGAAHISYFDRINSDLKYVTNASGSWETYALDWSDDVGEYSSIAVDLEGSLHISYYDNTNDDLKYATNASGSWETFTLDSAGSVGAYSSIAVDSEGAVHISYYDWDYNGLYRDPNKNGLKYATNSSGSWEIYTLDADENVGTYSSIAVDSEDAVHISYCGNGLKYATNASGSWETYTLDSDDFVANMYMYSSIAVDPEGTVHISYCGNGLKYATNSSGSWETYTLDSGGSVGEYNSIVVDSEGAIHISYYATWYYYKFYYALKYTTNSSGSWETYTLDSGGPVGKYSSIALDNEGAVHISYLDSGNHALRYTTNSSGSWEKFALDAAGTYTSIAVDPVGAVHISYYDSINMDLKHAFWDSAEPMAVCRNIIVQLDESGTASITPDQVYDGSAGNFDIDTMSVSPNTFTCSNLGDNIVTLTVTDTSGNSDNCAAIVTVQDTIPPEAKCKNIILTLSSSDSVYITPKMINEGSSDNCGIASMGVSSPYGFHSAGTYTVTLTVTDKSGNTDECTATITVKEQRSSQSSVRQFPYNYGLNQPFGGFGYYPFGAGYNTFGGGFNILMPPLSFYTFGPQYNSLRSLFNNFGTGFGSFGPLIFNNFGAGFNIFNQSAFNNFGTGFSTFNPSVFNNFGTGLNTFGTGFNPFSFGT